MEDLGCQGYRHRASRSKQCCEGFEVELFEVFQIRRDLESMLEMGASLKLLRLFGYVSLLLLFFRMGSGDCFCFIWRSR